FSWYRNSSSYARVCRNVFFDHILTQHQSILLRPLKDVDMVLQHNKIINLQLAVSKLHGVVIMPGQTFSLWKLVGRPTRRKGYVEGLTLVNGQISKGIGGGLCQLGNLLYWMALHSPLTITERWRHGYDVFPDINRTIPFACGATLSYNYVDLQLTNNTNSAIRINLWLDEEYLQGEIVAEQEPEYTYAVCETDHQIRHQWWGGYTRHNKIWKNCLSLDGILQSQVLVAENHAIMMYNPFLPATQPD
ncbi:MAG TPA: VanW family protein, partial [Bacteroidia bacterium]|nr:VanW family protein [Bacteroidia bacterium]